MSASLSGTAGQGSTVVANERAIGGAAVAVMIGALAVANFVAGGGNGGTGPFAVCAAVSAIVAALVFGRVLPGARNRGRAGRTALVLSVSSVVTLAVFWSGLPQVLAPAAVVLGLSAARSGERTAAIALASVAYALSLVAVFMG